MREVVPCFCVGQLDDTIAGVNVVVEEQRRPAGWESLNEKLSEADAARLLKLDYVCFNAQTPLCCPFAVCQTTALKRSEAFLTQIRPNLTQLETVPRCDCAANGLTLIPLMLILLMPVLEFVDSTIY